MKLKPNRPHLRLRDGEWQICVAGEGRSNVFNIYVGSEPQSFGAACAGAADPIAWWNTAHLRQQQMTPKLRRIA